MPKNEHEKLGIEQSNIPESKIQSAYAELKEREFPRNSLVVDIGGSEGQDAEYFINHGHSVTLIDNSAEALVKAEERAKNVEPGKLTVIKTVLGKEDIPLPHLSQDVVYSRLVLHFMDRSDTIRILQQIKQCLKIGGKAFLVIKSPEDSSEMDFLKQRAQELEPGTFDNKGQITTRFTEEQWKSILEDAGITNFSIKPYTEDISGRGDITKSGNTQLLLTEIEFTS